eukprot:g13275.t1
MCTGGMFYANCGYRQTAFAHEEALIEHYEMVHKQSFKDEKGKRQVEPSRRRKGSGRGSASGDDDPVQFRWPSTAEPQDYTTEADNEDQGDYNRYPNRDIVPLTRVDKGGKPGICFPSFFFQNLPPGSWRPTGKAEEGHPEDAQAEERKEEQEEEEEQGDAAKAQRDPTSAEVGQPAREVSAWVVSAAQEALHPALERLSFDCAMAKEGPRSGAPSCLSALHSALRALVTESEAEAEGWDVKLLPAIRKLNRAEVENLDEDSIDWEPLERLLGLRPMLYLLQATKAKQPSNSRSRQAIGPRQGQAEDEDCSARSELWDKSIMFSQ